MWVSRRARLDPGRRAEDEGWISAHVWLRSMGRVQIVGLAADRIALAPLPLHHDRPAAGGDLCHDGNQRRDHAWASDCARAKSTGGDVWTRPRLQEMKASAEQLPPAPWQRLRKPESMRFRGLKLSRG